MKILVPVTKLLSCIILLGIIHTNCYAQKLLESRQNSYYTYIYKITGAEAAKIYKKDIYTVTPSFFHTVVDSFITGTEYTGKLPQGHYLQRYADKNMEKCQITTVGDFVVYIVNNNTDLAVQVYDIAGNIIDDAAVKVRRKKLRYNNSKQSYTDKKSNQKGILQVTVKGFTTYYNLNRRYNNHAFKKVTGKILNKPPVKYIWLPVRYIIHLPADAVKSIKRGRAVGTIYRTKNFITKRRNGYNPKKNYKGYFVFSKPKYLPGDTVRFKAFITDYKGRPLNKSLKVTLSAPHKSVELTTLAPYNKGGYTYAFYLHDTLQLQLDRYYSVTLNDKNNKQYSAGSFMYEDYELAKNKLTLRNENKEHYRGNTLKILAKGTDENELNLADALVEVLVTPAQTKEYFEPYTFVPDTILFFKKQLAASGETEIVIADSLFPKLNFEYEIAVRMLTSDNEAISETTNARYYYNSRKLNIEMLTDSLLFTYAVNGIRHTQNATIIATDNFGNKTEIYDGAISHKVAFTPYYASYTIVADSISETLDIKSKASLLQCFSQRTADSVQIVVDNPRKLPFTYSIFRQNHKLTEGYGTQLNFNERAESKKNYFVTIAYLWGGKMREDTYRVSLADKQLNIQVTQPRIVYPGQKTYIELHVKDIKNQPVEGVDITAYGLTKKFNYAMPALPYMGKTMPGKSVVNNFNFENFNHLSSRGISLNYELWKQLAHIDTIEYYRFAYPADSVYQFSYPAVDSITQFAPFVFNNGVPVPVHVVYVDNKPVYFSWTTNPSPYSFQVNSGYHQVKLRTGIREIVIDSMYFKKGEKLIFSINQDTLVHRVKTLKKENNLDEREKRFLYNYMVPYRNLFGDRMAFIEQDKHVQLLSGNGNNSWRTGYAGPFNGFLSFELLNGYTTRFSHEPGFEYEFQNGLLKMRSTDVKRYPAYLSSYSLQQQALTDTVLTRKAILEKWQNYIELTRYRKARYIYPLTSVKGTGRLQFQLNNIPGNKLLQPLNVLIFRYDDHEFLRVYPGSTRVMHQLSPGYYKLIFFYANAQYHTYDSVQVQSNGLNYYLLQQPATFNKDAFSVEVHKMIESTIFNSPGSGQNSLQEKIFDEYRQQHQYTGVGNIIQGYVYDATTKKPLTGVSVLVKGTIYGTATNAYGFYSINAPLSSELMFSYIAYVPLTINTDKQIPDAVYLTQDQSTLEEVVVVGYGVQRRSVMTGAVSVVSGSEINAVTGTLTGKVPGIQITGATPGGGVNITIRGAQSVSLSKTPLYIINGNVFTGDISELDQNLIKNIQVLNDASATAIYGARGANGVVIIETDAAAFKVPDSPAARGADYDDQFLEAAAEAASIRSDFSDAAFWQPKLLTDKNGKAGFEVIFPDDVTSWQTYFLAMNNNRQTGRASGLIKSYKPLMAQLAVPRFMIAGDTTYAIGKSLNYTPDTVAISTRLEVNGSRLFTKNYNCTNAVIDSLPFSAGPDSVLTVKYYLETKDGYFDGEQKEIPVFASGLEETKGDFYALETDTTVHLAFDNALGPVTLYAQANMLDVIEHEIIRLQQYRYLCNEQLASKLKALLAAKTIAEFKGAKFRYTKDIEKMIQLLKKRQNSSGLWGWWEEPAENIWMSLHILEALLQAEKNGFKIPLNKQDVTAKLQWSIENENSLNNGLRIIKMLKILGAVIDYNEHITRLEKLGKKTLNNRLSIIELKQLCGLLYNLDSAKFFKRTSLFGNTYFADTGSHVGKWQVHINEIQNTILAYKILRAGDSTGNAGELLKIRNYLLETRQKGYWNNTFESAQIIETILPELIKNNQKIVAPELRITGSLNQNITTFPYETRLLPGDTLTVQKTGAYPVYVTAWQKYWNSNPVTKKGTFEVNTRFAETKGTALQAGQPVKLQVEVVVQEDAPFVMINVPIPAGCSYGTKSKTYGFETHREYFKNETAIFCENLPKGHYTFEINLVTRYAGRYTLNPAKAELMYFPVLNANNEIKPVVIQ